jgi:hypothetical protein
MSWFSDFVSSLSNAFSGGGSSSSSGSSGSSQAPTSSPRPQQRPSIMTVQRDSDSDRQLVATQDMPRFGISAGQSESVPSYSALSLQGLTSKDPGNVMRNIQGAERQAAAMPMGGSDREDTPAAAPAAAPVAMPPASRPESPATGLMSEAAQEAQIEEAGETAAAAARRLGRASTIATSPGGLLAGGEGTTRRRRSLMGGGLIA